MAQGLLALVEGRLPRAGRILEIGCGTGYFTQLLKQGCNGASLVALDLDAALVAAARRKAGGGRRGGLAGGRRRDPEPGELRRHRGQCQLPVAHPAGRVPGGLL